MGGIRLGLVVRHMAPKSEVAGSILRWVLKIAGWPGRFINVLHCGGLSMVLMQLEGPLKLLIKRREFLRDYGVLSRRDMPFKAVESDVKPQNFLLFAVWVRRVKYR